MKKRQGFVSNSSSSSFIIKYDNEKEINIKMKLGVFLKLLDTYKYFDLCENEDFTEKDIQNKEFPNFWKFNKDKNTIKGRFRKGGNAPSQFEGIIKELYGNLESFFIENGIEIEELYEN